MLTKVVNIHESGVTGGTEYVIVAGCNSAGTAGVEALLSKTRKTGEILEDLLEIPR